MKVILRALGQEGLMVICILGVIYSAFFIKMLLGV